jgi:hypothetical protein
MKPITPRVPWAAPGSQMAPEGRPYCASAIRQTPTKAVIARMAAAVVSIRAGSRKEVFFLERKNQRAFIHGQLSSCNRLIFMERSLFASFSSEKD